MMMCFIFIFQLQKEQIKKLQKLQNIDIKMSYEQAITPINAN